MNNKQRQTEQLQKLQDKWNLGCKTAKKNLVAYVLRRSRSDYLRVVGSESGLAAYQTEVLARVTGIGTHRQIAALERGRVARIVHDAFAHVEPDTATGMIGTAVMLDVLGDVTLAETSLVASPSVLILDSDDRIENFNPRTGVVPGPVSARSSVALQAVDPVGLGLRALPRVGNYVVDPTSPTNIYTRDMLKAMGYTDPPPREPVDDNDGWPTMRSLVSRGAEKLKRANYRRTGAVTGSIAAVALVSLGTSISANATTSSSEAYARQFTTSYTENRETQSLHVSDTAPALSAGRGPAIYRPDMIWPTVAGAGVTISSGFGYREAPCSACSTDHRGLDMNPGYGTEVYSATSGTVVSVGWNGSLGWEVLVQDEGNRQYAYGHMVANSTPADVVAGAKVTQGQVIGLVGSTGLSTGAHLHFEVIEDGVQIDPLPELLRWAH